VVQDYYGPSNATLVIAGDIDVKTAREGPKVLWDIPPVPGRAPDGMGAKMTGVHRQQRRPRASGARVQRLESSGYGQGRHRLLDLVSDVRRSRIALNKRLVMTSKWRRR